VAPPAPVGKLPDDALDLKVKGNIKVRDQSTTPKYNKTKTHQNEIKQNKKLKRTKTNQK
jgi:hypothetical protein